MAFIEMNFASGNEADGKVAPITCNVISTSVVQFQCDREVNQLILLQYTDATKTSAWIYTWTDIFPTVSARYINGSSSTPTSRYTNSSLTRNGNTYTFTAGSFVIGRTTEVYAITTE